MEDVKKLNKYRVEDVIKFEEFMVELDKNYGFLTYTSKKDIGEEYIEYIFNEFAIIIKEYFSLFIEPDKYDITKEKDNLS